MKALRVLLKVAVVALASLLVVAGALWTWSGTDTSLLATLDRLARYLPAGQTLTVQDVTGSLRSGGHIGLLRWQQGELTVEARNVQVAWALQPLLSSELRVGHLSAGHLRIEDRRAPTAPAPLTPPTDLRLPIRVDVPFSVATVEWVGSTTLQATRLAGHYTFDSYLHRLNKGQVHISSGTYQFGGSVQAQAPMALAVELDGTVQTTLPSGNLPLTVQARATLAGDLAPPDATLALAAELTPEPVASAAANASAPAGAKPANPRQALQANITAQLKPWQLQPIASANANWHALDLAALWPQAPRTQLSGQASVSPAGSGWLGQVQLTNALSGALDQQRLPLDSLNAKVIFVDQQWTIESLQATGAGGRLTAQGQLTGAKASLTQSRQSTQSTQASQAITTPPDTPATWQGTATAYGINPAALDSRLAATALDGQLTAQQTPNGIRFDAHLQPGKATPKPTRQTHTDALAGLRLTQVQAQGIWTAPTLTLDTLQVTTDDAQLQGQLTFDTTTQATQGKLTLTAPGVDVVLAGQLASTRGGGDLRVSVLDAALATRWLQRWPGLNDALGGTTLQGGAELTGRWHGGWQQQGQALQIDAQLRAPQLDLRTANQSVAQAWRLSDWQAEVSGSLQTLSVSLRGTAGQATRRFTIQAAAQGGRAPEGRWQGRLDSLQFGALDSVRPGPWLLQISDPVTLAWQATAAQQQLNVSGGTARLNGPVPGNALVTWQPVRWSQQAKGPADWATQGRLQNLPLAWLELLGQTQLANLGLRGDLVFGGAWEASGGRALKLRASIERTSGDLQLQADEATQGADLQAGVREARLLVSADDAQVTTRLVWNSERAGQIQAQASTRLALVAGAWQWPLDALVSGTLNAQLPPVGAWSLLAPPGWRLRGTLNAGATLSGTRGAPAWRGNLSAQDLAVRSVVDGIDLSNGRLHATLNGQRLDINDFSLQGAGGQSGGTLSIKGKVQWLPPGSTAGSTVSRLRMALEATAQNLRVSARADRRLSVSGNLTAQLTDARLVLRGKLTADQALLILPEDSVPQLGRDVRVRQTGERSVAPARAKPPPAEPGARVVPELAVSLDLGSNFEVRGRGLNTRLAGTLELTNLPGDALMPRLSGQLRTVRGTYKAYGQQLDIERGVLRFDGPFDNPALDVLALRPNLQQRVGVQISGSALSPIVRLYAQPELPDAEKLSWLILGRSSASGGAEAALLQQAAMALLGGSGPGLSGSLAAALGLDELSVRGSTTGDGTTGAAVTLGKRISQDFYVAYESSLAGAMGTLYIFYDLTRRFTLRAQAGEQSAIDLIFTLRYD